MLSLFYSIATIVGFTCSGIAALYSLLALTATFIWRIRASRAITAFPALRPPVSILKPLCGLEPGLYEHLRSFCEQDYPQYQLIFGVRDPTDPALGVVAQLVAEFPALPIAIVINSQLYGDNYKSSNLMNMLEVSQHDVLVFADSDAWVGRDYLSCVTAPLNSAQVGLVTCIYRGVPTLSVWSRLGAMYINEWFIPSVRLAWIFGHENYASGQTLCLRRDTLEAIGGLQPIVGHLADDYRLGELIRGLGLKIVLSRYEIDAEQHEPTLRSLTNHQLRWMRTLQILRPRSFRFIFLTFSQPLALIGCLFTSFVPTVFANALVWVLSAFTVGAQLLLHLAHRRRCEHFLLADLLLIPARDALLCWIWLRTFFVPQVRWRGSEFRVDSQGVMHRSA